MQCEERGFPLNDGAKRIFLNTRGKNVDEVSQVLLDFLGYLNDSTDTYIEQNPNEKVKEIHNRIKVLKKNRDVEARYMHYLYFDEVIAQMEKRLDDKSKELDDKDALVHEMIFETIEELGEVSEVVRESIRNEKNPKVLKSIHTIAVKAVSIKQFEEAIANL